MTTSTIPEHAADIERGLGAVPLEEIEAELDANEPEWSKLAALHGPFGKWNDVRKALLSATALRLRDGWSIETQGKLTEAALDQAAHADPEYQAAVNQAVIDHARYLELQAMRDRHEMRYNRGQAMLRSDRR